MQYAYACWHDGREEAPLAPWLKEERGGSREAKTQGKQQETLLAAW
jgi:hypothetical protein